MSERIKYTVDIDKYWEGFVESSTMSPEEALIETKQNVKPKDNGEAVIFDVNFLNSEFTCVPVQIKNIKTKINKKKIEIESYEFITIEDDSDKPMTKEDGKNTMNSLSKKISRGKSVGCFNFGEILAMSKLAGSGRVVYCNKKTNETWVILFNEGTPVFEMISVEDKILLDNILEKSKNPNRGTLKIVCPNKHCIDKLDTELFENSCSYIDTCINGEAFKKYETNSTFNKILSNSEYKFKKVFNIYIDVKEDPSAKSKFKVNVYLEYESNGELKIIEYRNATERFQFKKGNNLRNNRIFNRDNKISIETAIIPYEFYDLKNYNNLIYIFDGHTLPIKKDSVKILQFIYPNIGGNISLKKSFTIIKADINEKNLDKNMFIKKNICSFYPDKLKSGDPIITWKYIKTLITSELEKHYNFINSHQEIGELFHVRNNYVPSFDNNIYQKNGSEFKKYPPEEEPEPEPEEEPEPEPKEEPELRIEQNFQSWDKFTWSYFGIKNCSRPDGIACINDMYECHFGITSDDPKHRDTGSGLGTDWRRLLTINLNHEGKQQENGKLAIENILYKKINETQKVIWNDGSREYFKVKKEFMGEIFNMVSDLMNEYRNETW